MNSLFSVHIFLFSQDKPAVLCLQNLIVRDIANQQRGMFLISHSTPPEMYELHAASKDDRNTWMKLIQQTVSKSESIHNSLPQHFNASLKYLRTSNTKHFITSSVYLYYAAVHQERISLWSKLRTKLCYDDSEVCIKNLLSKHLSFAQISFIFVSFLSLSSWYPAEGSWSFGAVAGACDIVLWFGRGHRRSEC